MRLRSRKIAWITGAALIACAASGFSQVDLSGWPQVRMEMLAIDRDGNPVPGVTADALQSRGSGRPRPVIDLQPSQQPQSVCVLLDASDGDRWSMAQGKARKLIRNLDPNDEVCVAAFSSQLWIAQDLTTNRRAAENALGQVRPQGGTQLRDAILYLADYMRKTSRNRSRAIILISDGTDHNSAMSWEQLRRGMQLEGSPVVHMVCLPEAFGHARAKQFDPHQSEAFRITEIGGGLTYFPHTMADFNGVLEALPVAMNSRYVLTVQAENAARDGHEERLEVSFDKAHRSERAHLQAPEGFYAPSQ